MDACYGDTMKLPCESGSVLVVDTVQYEEVTSNECLSMWPTSKCSPLRSVAALRRRCHGEGNCSLSTEDVSLRCTPLPWAEEMRLQIQVSYRCVPGM